MRAVPSSSAFCANRAVPRVTVYGDLFNSRYLSQWVAGLVDLEVSGTIRLRWSSNPDMALPAGRASHAMWLGIEFSAADKSEALIYLDMRDTDKIPDLPELERCDLYLKRGFRDVKVAQLPEPLRSKLTPMPLNYPVSSPNETVAQLLGRALQIARWRAEPAESARGCWLALLRKLPLAHKFGVRQLPVSRRELLGDPRATLEPGIYFRTRLYDPLKLSAAENQQRIADLNNSRIDLIRTLREAFGERVFCGLYETKTSQRLAPDLIRPLPAGLKGTDGHRNFSRRFLINVNSVGVSGSNGWKIGEILAAGNVLVTEQLRQQPLDMFTPGVEAEEFVKPEECVAACQRLLDDPERAAAMRMAGHSYYQRALAPASAMSRILTVVERKLHAAPQRQIGCARLELPRSCVKP